MGQFWPIFMADLLQLKKIGNTYQIWLKTVLFDGEFIEDCVKAKNSKNQRLLAEEIDLTENGRFFCDYSKFSDFGQNAMGQFWPIFMADLLQLKKIGNTYQIWLKTVLFDGEFIEDCVKAKNSKNQRLLAEK